MHSDRVSSHDQLLVLLQSLLILKIPIFFLYLLIMFIVIDVRANEAENDIFLLSCLL